MTLTVARWARRVTASRVAKCAAAMIALSACTTGGAREANAPSAEPTSTTSSTPAASSTTAAPTVPLAEPAAVEVRLDHYAIEPRAQTVPAGVVTLTASNRDRVPHDVVLIRTTLASDALPTSGVRVDENDPVIDVLARTARLASKGTGSLTAMLQPGTYVLVCTVPHHYVREAMVATITATG